MYVYVLVRRDLPPSHQTVQAAHAAMLSASQFFPNGITDTPNLVLCGVADEAELIAAHEKLVRLQIPCCPYMEPDFGDAMTAVATGPLVGGQRQPLRSYRLL